MALATPHPDTAPAAVAGLAAGVRRVGDATEVTVRSAAGDLARVDVDGAPDERAARHVAAGYRRLTWQRIDIDGDDADCRVQGVRHRLPADSRVSVGAALALAIAGLPTVVHVHGDR